MIRTLLSFVASSVLAAAGATLLLAQGTAPRDGRPSQKDGPSSNGNSYTVPRTPWGHPDLQGVWTTDDARSVPLQRPMEFGDRRLLTDQEFARSQTARRRNAW